MGGPPGFTIVGAKPGVAAPGRDAALERAGQIEYRAEPAAAAARRMTVTRAFLFRTRDTATILFDFLLMCPR
jgi:hypothetical protein